MAKLVLDQAIESIETPWDGAEGAYPGKRVEEFIKKQFKGKAGYLSRSTEREADNNYHLRGFADEDRYNEWNSDMEAYAANVLFDVSLPSGDGSSSATSYILNLVNGSERTIITTSRKLSVKLRFTSQVFNPATQQTTDTGEMGVLTIQTKVEGASNWSTKGTLKIESYPADSTDWVDVPIGDYLTLGQQSVRVICRGETTELSTTYVSYSIMVTSLALEFATTWESPFDGERIPLSYYVTGNIAKDLTVRVTGKDYDQTFTRSLGTSVYTETPYILEIDSPKKHGVYTVTAYLSSGSAVKTDDLVSQVMVSEEGATGVLMALNGIRRDITNWNTVRFFEWAIFNPAAETTPVTFRLMDDTLTEAYFTEEIAAAANRTRYDLSAMVEVETEEGAGDTLNGRMLFHSGDTELRQQLLFIIDNSENFSPTKGADFILNPKQRTNTEENPFRIINQETGEEVPSAWSGFGLLTDGWQADSAGAKCLRLLAGSSVNIDYESFSEATGQTQEDSLTIEIDYASRNATDLEEPIIRMCSTYTSDGLPLGLRIKPQEVHFLTTGHRTPGDQDVMFQEDTRTHLAVNIIYNLGGHGINYVRLFINGIINREFVYTATDKFIQRVNGVLTSEGIRIGSSSSDVDIYGIRVYKKALSATDIRQDYMASMTEVSEKIAFRDKNDILYNNLINYERATQKYNTMCWTGQLPYMLDQSSKTGDLTINILNDPTHSGTIKGMSVKGQGSSSKKYFLWNHQYGFGDFNWIDGNGTDRGKVYRLTDDVPDATKLVAKLNWASSQQSHKAGSCDLYYEVWKEVVGGNSITQTDGFEKCRPCVKELPFLMFARADESSEPVFYGLVTFGPGKGDKPTFGYDKKVFPDYLMIEGSDNGAVLTLHQAPWNEDVEPALDDEGVIEGWQYNGVVSWDLDLGNEASVTYFQAAHNFIYLCSNRLKPFVGTLAQLQAAGADLEKDKMYWVTVDGGDAVRYDLFRYDWLTSTWVDAGVNKLGVGQYEKLNLRTQLNDYLSGFDESEAVQNQIWDEVNNRLIAARVAMFKAGIGQYYNLSDTRYTMMMMMLIAASDNRAKNTYQYLDPVSHLICFAQDDMDTIFLTDNLGRKDKPYYVEEHDLNASGKNYWNGEVNTFYNLMELAFPAELRSTMKAIFTAMAKIGGGTVMGCFDKFFFRIQRYFPAVAYNETARLLYELGEQMANEGLYNPPSVSAISQSLGDQLQGETQFLKMRTTYLASFCSYGDFSIASSQSISFRSRYNKAGRQPVYTFSLKPFMWLYPAMAVGQSLNFGADKDGKAYGLPQRVKAGDTYTISFITDNDTPCALLAPDCYSGIGNWGDKPLTGEFALSGRRLTEFSAGREEGIGTVEFNASSFKINTPNLKRLNLNGVEALAGVLDLSKLTRAESLSVAGTALSTVTLPKTGSLGTLELPARLTSVRIDSLPGLVTATIEGAANLQTVYVDQAGAGAFDSRQFLVQLYAGAGEELSSVTFRSVHWENLTADILMFLCDRNADLTGSIAMMYASDDRYITFDEKMKLIGRYGDIDSTENPLYISYTARAINSMTMQGDNYIFALGEYTGFRLSVLPSTANNVKIVDGHAAVRWSLDGGASLYAEFTDPVNGILTVKRTSDPALKERFTVTVEVTTMDDKVFTLTKQVGFFNRVPEIGDFAYADGTFDNVYDPGKTLAGVVFMRKKVSDTEYELRIDAAEDIEVKDNNTTVNSWPWGLYPEAAATNGFPEAVEDAIQGATGMASATDTAMPNITSTGLPLTTDPNGNPSTNHINEDNYIDDNTEDGYAVLTDGSVNDFDGKEKTDIIIEHCNRILLNYLDAPLPETIEELVKAMTDLAASNSGAKKYWQFYYPAAYLCRLYEPKAETVHEQYRSGNWYLPSEGELARLYNFHNCSRGFKINTTPTVDYANEHPASEARLPLFANLLKRVADVNVGAKPFALHTSAWYWSSTEYSRGSAWFVGFSNGGTSSGSKCNNGRVRAVAAFTFKL